MIDYAKKYMKGCFFLDVLGKKGEKWEYVNDFCVRFELGGVMSLLQ